MLRASTAASPVAAPMTATSTIANRAKARPSPGSAVSRVAIERRCSQPSTPSDTIASVFIASIYPRIDKRQWAMRIGLPLALGGAIGNLVDRMRHGWVVDFIHFWIKRDGRDFHWPTFNVADVWIVMGVGFLAIDVFTSRKIRKERALFERDEMARASQEPASSRTAGGGAVVAPPSR